MAKFTALGNLKFIFDGDKAFNLGCEPREIFGTGIFGEKSLPKNSVRYKRRESNFSKSQKVWSVEKNIRLSSELVDDEEMFEKDELSNFRGLVLDIAYRPVNVVCWKRAICLEYTEKVDVLEYYDQTVASPSGFFYIPAVLRVPHLLQVIKRRRIKHTLSRKSIFYRDSYTCQYCYSRVNLTIDHVLPVSQGGEWTWENLVTACAKCNSKKGQQTLEEANMKLIKAPKAPKDYDILSIPLTTAAAKMLKRTKGVPEEWLQYLPN